MSLWFTWKNTSRITIHRNIKMYADNMRFIRCLNNAIQIKSLSPSFKPLKLSPAESSSRSDNSNIRWRQQKLGFLAISLVCLDMSTLLVSFESRLIFESVIYGQPINQEHMKGEKRREGNVWRASYLHHSHNNLLWAITRQRLGLRYFVHNTAWLSILNRFGELSTMSDSLLKYCVRDCL